MFCVGWTRDGFQKVNIAKKDYSKGKISFETLTIFLPESVIKHFLSHSRLDDLKKFFQQQIK